MLVWGSRGAAKNTFAFFSAAFRSLPEVLESSASRCLCFSTISSFVAFSALKRPHDAAMSRQQSNGHGTLNGTTHSRSWVVHPSPSPPRRKRPSRS